MITRKVAHRWQSLTHHNSFRVLEHHKMEKVKESLGLKKEKAKRTLGMKMKFLWKETKYTLVQGCRDFWSDTKWIINLYKTKESYEFTGFEMH